MGRSQRPPAVVWLVTAVHVGLCLVYAVLLPVYAGPREAEQVHLHLRASEQPLEWSGSTEPLAPVIRSAVAGFHFSDDPDQRLLVGAASSRPDRPTFAALGDAPPPPGDGAPLTVHPRPPAHAHAGALWRAVAPGIGGVAHDVQVLHLRLLNALLLAPLPLLLHAIARRLSPAPAVALAAALGALAVPMLQVVGGAVTADGLLVVAAAVATLRGLDVVRGDASIRATGALGLATAVAALTSGLGLALVGWTAVVLVVASRRLARDGVGWRPPAAAVLVPLLPVAAWWWHALAASPALGVVVPRPERPAWLGIAQGVVLPDVTPAGAVLAEGTHPLLDAVAELVAGVFGVVGFARAPFPLPWALAGVLVLVLGAGLAIADRWQRGRERTDVLLLLLPLVLLLAVVAAAAAGAPRPLAVVEGSHLLAGAPGLLVVAAVGFGAAVGERRRAWLPAAVLAMAGGAQAILLMTAAAVSWGPGDAGLAASLEAWWIWVPVPVRVLAGALLPAVLGAGVLVAAVLVPPLRTARSRADPVGGSASRARLVLGANLGVLAAVWAGLRLADRAGVPRHELVRDTIAVVGGELHAGIVSNAGVLVWAAGGGLCLLAGSVLAGRAELRRHAGLLLGVGALTLVLAADDLLQLHEGLGIGPQWLGIPEAVIIGAYGIALAGLVIAYRDLLVVLPGGWVLLVAVGGFAVSLGIDAVDSRLLYVVGEDVAKLVGIVNWTIGWGIAAHALLRGAIATRTDLEAVAYTPSASSKPMPQSRSRSLEE